MRAERIGRTWVLIAAGALLCAGCGGSEGTAPAAPSGGATQQTGQVTVKCAGCGKTATVAAGATPPSC